MVPSRCPGGKLSCGECSWCADHGEHYRAPAVEQIDPHLGSPGSNRFLKRRRARGASPRGKRRERVPVVNFYEFATNSPWLTFFLCTIVGEVVVRIAVTAFTKQDPGG